MVRATLVLLSYNQIKFVGEAARHCLAQDCEPIEIIFSDDASSDGSFELLRQIAAEYQGPHQVLVRRNEKNLGIGEHYNRVIAEAQGDLIITAAGDDISETHRVRTLLQAWDAEGCQALLLSSHLVKMSLDGRLGERLAVDDLARWSGVKAWLTRRPHVVGAAHAFSRRLHQHFGPFIKGLTYEDQIMALRASALGRAITVDEPLVRYRDGGISSKGPSSARPGARRQRLITRHASHRFMYQQVLNDLKTLKQENLFPRKMAWRLTRSTVVMELLGVQSLPMAWGVIRRHFLSGPAASLACVEACLKALWLHWVD
jgi:glycosyltransferase involved in cell wall biosynthesis